MNYTSLNQWVEENTRELGKELQLSTLVNDNERLKRILNTGIAFQTDLKSLEQSLESINSLINDFPLKTNNHITGNKTSINLRQQMQILSQKYTHFLHQCTQTSNQCEYYAQLLQKITQINDTFLRSIAEVEQSKVNHSRRLISLNFSLSPSINSTPFSSLVESNWIN